MLVGGSVGSGGGEPSGASKLEPKLDKGVGVPLSPRSLFSCESSASFDPAACSVSSTCSLDCAASAAFRSATRSFGTVVNSRVTSGGSCSPFMKVSNSWNCCDGKLLDETSITSLAGLRRASEAERRRCAAAAARESGA